MPVNVFLTMLPFQSNGVFPISILYTDIFYNTKQFHFVDIFLWEKRDFVVQPNRFTRGTHKRTDNYLFTTIFN